MNKDLQDAVTKGKIINLCNEQVNSTKIDIPKSPENFPFFSNSDQNILNLNNPLGFEFNEARYSKSQVVIIGLFLKFGEIFSISKKNADFINQILSILNFELDRSIRYEKVKQTILKFSIEKEKRKSKDEFELILKENLSTSEKITLNFQNNDYAIIFEKILLHISDFLSFSFNNIEKDSEKQNRLMLITKIQDQIKSHSANEAFINNDHINELSKSVSWMQFYLWEEMSMIQPILDLLFRNIPEISVYRESICILFKTEGSKAVCGFMVEKLKELALNSPIRKLGVKRSISEQNLLLLIIFFLKKYGFI